LDVFEIPQKFHTDFLSTNPSFTSKQNPFQIIQVLKKTLVNTSMCHLLTDDDENNSKWSIKVSTLSAAEEICFFIQLSKFFLPYMEHQHQQQQQQQQQQYQIDFYLLSGDEIRFVQFCEYICQLYDQDEICSPNKMDAVILDDWMDESKELKGKQFAIDQEEAKLLLEEINTPNGLHPETLYEITKKFKDNCRHAGNRQLFYEHHYEELIQALEWMLSDIDEIARFALFILLQFGKKQNQPSIVFFQRPIDKSNFQVTIQKLQQETIHPWTLELITKVFEKTNLFY
jgi:predicted RNA-binding protein